MDVAALSLKMKRLTIWLDRQCRGEGFIQKQFDGAPFGQCYVTLDPARQGPAASSNRNRVHLCGAEPGLALDGLQRLIDLFRDAGVQRFFVWLSPGPDLERVRGWLTDSGCSRIRWTAYPTLWRGSREPVPFRTDLDVREVGPSEVAAAQDRLGDTIWPEYAASAGKDGFVHYMAFDGKRPVAVAALAVFEDLGYLLAASTAEGDRKRGAQQALIARRIERAAKAGCAGAVVETLTMLEQSYRNLRRAGFEEVYDKEVYEWRAPDLAD
jgi:hypothetical protein